MSFVFSQKTSRYCRNDASVFQKIGGNLEESDPTGTPVLGFPELCSTAIERANGRRILVDFLGSSTKGDDETSQTAENNANFFFVSFNRKKSEWSYSFFVGDRELLVASTKTRGAFTTSTRFGSRFLEPLMQIERSLPTLTANFTALDRFRVQFGRRVPEEFQY